MDLFIDRRGVIRALYDETLDVRPLGTLAITRASYVEPDAVGAWFADLAPVGGPVLGPFTHRSEALAAESAWLARRLTEGPLVRV